MLRLELQKYQIDPQDIGRPFYFVKNESYDVTDYLIDGTLIGDYRVEFTQPFDFGSSRLSFELSKGAIASGMLGLSRLEGYIICVQLWNDGVADFIGGLNASSSYYSETEEKYVLNFIDMFKFLYDAHKGFEAEDIEFALAVSDPITGAPLTKADFLHAYNTFDFLGSGYPKTVINIGDEYAGIWTPAYENNCKDMYVNDFLMELIKHHSAYIYMRGDGYLVFCDRALGLSGTPRDITSQFLLDDLDKNFAYYPIFNSVLLNVFGAWEYVSPGVYSQWEGWALLYYENGEYTETLGINTNLSNIPKKFEDSYIDLRQLLGHPPDYSFSFNKIFGAKTRAETLNSFKQIINPQPFISGIYDGIDLSLLQKVIVNWDLYAPRDLYIYIVYNMLKDYTNGTSKLELIRV